MNRRKYFKFVWDLGTWVKVEKNGKYLKFFFWFKVSLGKRFQFKIDIILKFKKKVIDQTIVYSRTHSL